MEDNFYIKNVNIRTLLDNPDFINTKEFEDMTSLFDEVKEIPEKEESVYNSPYPVDYLGRLLLEKYQNKLDYDIEEENVNNYVLCVLMGRKRLNVDNSTLKRSMTLSLIHI